MKTASLKRAIEKLGIKIEMKQDKRYDLFTKQYELSSAYYYAKGLKYVLSWYDQDDLAICVHIQKLTDQSDSQRDYFPGYFCKTIKQAIEGILDV